MLCLYLSACLSAFPHDISKTDAARFTIRDIEVFHEESWEPILGINRSRSRVIKTIAGMGLCTLMSAGFFWLVILLSICLTFVNFLHLLLNSWSPQHTLYHSSERTWRLNHTCFLCPCNDSCHGIAFTAKHCLLQRKLNSWILLQCFYTVGWVTGNVSGLQKTFAVYFWRCRDWQTKPRNRE